MIAVPFALMVAFAITAWACLTVVLVASLRMQAHHIDQNADGSVACRECGPDVLCSEVR